MVDMYVSSDFSRFMERMTVIGIEFANFSFADYPRQDDTTVTEFTERRFSVYSYARMYRTRNRRWTETVEKSDDTSARQGPPGRRRPSSINSR